MFQGAGYTRPGVTRRRGPVVATLVVLTLGLVGCVSYSDLKPARQPSAVSDFASERSLGGDVPAAWPAGQWWQRFGDPQLDKLVAEALTGSPELELAGARLRAARAVAEVAGAAGNPGYNAAFNSTWQRFTENGVIPPPYGGMTHTNNDLTLNLNYHLDFWGRNRSALQAALSRQHFSEAEEAEARLLLTTAVASAYIELDHRYQLLDVAERTLKQRQAIYDLTEQRVQAGLDTRVQLKQAESELPAIRGSIAALHEAINASRYQLAALIGAGPDRGLAIGRPQLRVAATGSFEAPASVPAGLLGRRPDIVAARWRVEAADWGVKASKAEFYPNVNLAAFVGLSSIGLDNLVESGSRVYGAGPAISLPLFARHTLRGHLKEQLATYDAAVASYDRALVDALKEVATSINAGRWLVQRRSEQRAALKTAEEALSLATQRYRAGLGNYLTVLQAQTSVLQSEREGAALDARALELHIQLIKALGGGFDDAAGVASHAKQTTGVDHDNARS